MAPVAQGEQLPALHDEPEDVMERLETFPDGILSLSVWNHLRTVTDTRYQALQHNNIKTSPALSGDGECLVVGG